MKFNYTALSGDNQKLTGVLESESLEAAQSDLHKMGLSIIAIGEISDIEYAKLTAASKTVSEQPEGAQTFIFEGLDANGKDINGTIDSADDYSAYKRLLTEYKFKIRALYLLNASDTDKEKSKSFVAEWDERMRAEGIKVAAPFKSGTKEFDDTYEKIDKKIVEEIDQFIINTKKVIAERSNLFSAPFLREIEKTLGELERIRTSNNIRHISQVCNQLYELISNPDQISDTGNVSDNMYQKILDSMKDTSLVKREFDIYSKAIGLSKIQTIFKRITEKLLGKSKNIGQTKPKTGLQKLLSKLSGPAKQKPRPKPKAYKPSSLGNVLRALFSYLSAPNAMLRKARKSELSKAYTEWRSVKKTVKAVKPKVEKVTPVTPAKMEEVESDFAEATSEPRTGKHDFTGLFMEADSFVSWLLFFYIAYFFLVSFSLERDIGLPRDFVIKTLKSPLIVDIAICLVFLHFIFRLKTLYFRRNFVGSMFLILFGLGIYFLIVINF
jgi:hypothetical protein